MKKKTNDRDYIIYCNIYKFRAVEFYSDFDLTRFLVYFLSAFAKTDDKSETKHALLPLCRLHCCADSSSRGDFGRARRYRRIHERT